MTPLYHDSLLASVLMFTQMTATCKYAFNTDYSFTSAVLKLDQIAQFEVGAYSVNR